MPVAFPGNMVLVLFQPGEPLMQRFGQRLSTRQDIAAEPSWAPNHTAVGERTVDLSRRPSAEDRFILIGAAVLSVLRVAAKRYRLALLAPLALMSCADSGPTCSEDRVTDLVKQIAGQQIPALSPLRRMYRLDKSSYEVRSIRTIDKTDRACKCAASLHYRFDLSDERQKNLEANIEDYESDLDIKYNAQLTDDGKEVHVEVRGF